MIRSAQARDVEQIATLWNWMVRDTLATFTTQEKSSADLQALLDQRPGGFFVFVEKERVLGFVTFGSFRSGPGYGATCEHSVIVSPAAQGRRIGAKLMAQAESAARAKSQHIMVAAISGANPQAVAFHEKIGFEQVGHLPEVGRKSGRWLDLILMQKML